MIGDLVIISLALASGWAAYKLFTIKSQYSVFAFCAGLFLVSFLIGGIIVPNKNLLFPKIHGKLIDSDTLQPVPDALVVISWLNRYSVFPGQGRGGYPKSLLIKSDVNGAFSGPSRYISLAIELPFYARENIVFVRVFHPNYEIGATEIENTGSTTINMKKISTLGQLSGDYEFCQRFDKNGNAEEKKFARICKENIDRQRKEFSQRSSAAPNHKNAPDQKAVR